jgi:hypothetical protein
MGSRSKRRYRRHRILGMLPALVLVAGGIYLGLAQRGWLGLVIGVVFLLLSAGMIAIDRPPPRSSAPIERTNASQPRRNGLPQASRSGVRLHPPPAPQQHRRSAVQ